MIGHRLGRMETCFGWDPGTFGAGALRKQSQIQMLRHFDS